jgi:hypothetical protein
LTLQLQDVAFGDPAGEVEYAGQAVHVDNPSLGLNVLAVHFVQEIAFTEL